MNKRIRKIGWGLVASVFGIMATVFGLSVFGLLFSLMTDGDGQLLPRYRLLVAVIVAISASILCGNLSLSCLEKFSRIKLSAPISVAAKRTIA